MTRNITEFLCTRTYNLGQKDRNFLSRDFMFSKMKMHFRQKFEYIAEILAESQVVKDWITKRELQRCIQQLIKFWIWCIRCEWDLFKWGKYWHVSKVRLNSLYPRSPLTFISRRVFTVILRFKRRITMKFPIRFLADSDRMSWERSFEVVMDIEPPHFFFFFYKSCNFSLVFRRACRLSSEWITLIG
jgi:hypothetical protein